MEPTYLGDRDYSGISSLLGSLLGHAGAGVMQGSILRDLLSQPNLGSPTAASQIAALPLPLQQSLHQEAARQQEKNFLESVFGGGQSSYIDELFQVAPTSPHPGSPQSPIREVGSAAQSTGVKAIPAHTTKNEAVNQRLDQLYQALPRAPNANIKQAIQSQIRRLEGSQKELAKNAPTPPEISDGINEILENPENEGISPTQLHRKLLSAGIPEEYAKDITETYGKEQESKGRETEKVREYNKEYISGVRDRYRASFEALNDLNQLEVLAEEGNLPTPALAKLMDRFDIPIGLLGNPNAEELEKLTARFYNGIKSVFGSQISKIEVENFAKQLPRLINTDEGKKRIIKAMRLIQEGNQLEWKVMREIMKEKGNYADLSLDVQEVLAPAFAELANRFRRETESIEIEGPTGGKYLIPAYLVEEFNAAQ